ncbi:MAG TPA: nickel-type superoxide dismutase maturation protease [Candidatus Dormibacteraeota bacterium]|nr:nickel-type superoxide dismutase maturation protease [Candidatus Dormibacteraeota bacterium]HVC23086.1 nickel-type superoxide dismutase maturation protease [Candidatus Dormibacteraeota bacterium]
MVSGKLTRLAGRIHTLTPQLAVVQGKSMEPTLPEGAWVLVSLVAPGGPRLGQVVVVEHPRRAGFELIKRVSAVSRERRLIWVAGDNRRASTDSEDFGPVPRELVRGVVRACVRPLPWHWLRPDPSRLV